MYKKIIFSMLTILSFSANAKEDSPLDKLKPGIWNNETVNAEEVVINTYARLSDSKNKNDIGLFLATTKEKENIYPFIGFSSKKTICEECEVKVSFDGKNYEDYLIKEVDKNGYKINKIGFFYKNFEKYKQVYVRFPKFGEYKYLYSDLNINFPKENWFNGGYTTNDKEEVKISTLGSDNIGATILLTKIREEITAGIQTYDFKCKYKCEMTLKTKNKTQKLKGIEVNGFIMIVEQEKFIDVIKNEDYFHMKIKNYNNDKKYYFDNSEKDYNIKM